MLLKRDRHIGRRANEENSKEFCAVSENLRSRIALSQQTHSPFPFADLRINPLRAKWSAHPPPPFFFSSQAYHLPEIHFLPLILAVTQGAVLSSKYHMWHFFYSHPKIHFKVRVNIFSQMCIIPGPSDRCSSVAVDQMGIAHQEGEIIWETIKQLLIPPR